MPTANFPHLIALAPDDVNVVNVGLVLLDTSPVLSLVVAPLDVAIEPRNVNVMEGCFMPFKYNLLLGTKTTIGKVAYMPGYALSLVIGKVIGMIGREIKKQPTTC